MIESGMNNTDYKQKNPIFSILCPTRGRPENVRRFIDSIKYNCDNFNNIEILFYVDDDDTEFPNEVLDYNIKKITGRRIWISLAWNVLYVHSRGSIFMYAGDDLVFKTKGWDTIVFETFETFKDRILLVYGNDNGWHGSKIAIHGFVHSNWVNALGYFTYPGRTSPLDLWFTDVAKRINRAVYLPLLILEHVHYRQGAASAHFDKTYQETDQKNKAWTALTTYKKLKRERRIDRVMLGKIMSPRPNLEYNYFIGELISKIQMKKNLNIANELRLLSLSNIEILPILLANIVRVILRKRNFSKN